SSPVSRDGRTLDVMDGDDFVRLVQENHPGDTVHLGVADPGSKATEILGTDPIDGRIVYDTDWHDAIFRTAISFDHNLSARGSVFKTVPIRLSLGYTESQGLVKTNDYERITGSLKLSPRFFDDHLKVELNAKGIISDKNAVDEGGALGGAIKMDPTKPIFDPDPNNRFGGYY